MDRFPGSGNLVTADVYMGTCASVCKFMFCQDPLQRKLLIQMLDWELFQQGGRERSVDYYFIPRHCIYLNDQTATIQERQTCVQHFMPISYIEKLTIFLLYKAPGCFINFFSCI